MHKGNARRAEAVGPYQFFMLALCVWALLTLAASTFLNLDDDVLQVLRYADTAVCVLFLFDFCYTLYRAENRWKYLLTWGWIDLLSSVPTVGSLRLGRLGRLMRIVRVLR